MFSYAHLPSRPTAVLLSREIVSYSDDIYIVSPLNLVHSSQPHEPAPLTS